MQIGVCVAHSTPLQGHTVTEVHAAQFASVAPFGSRPGVLKQAPVPPSVVDTVVSVVDVVGASVDMAIVVEFVETVLEQSQAWPAPHGHCPAGSMLQTAAHLELLAPNSSAPFTAVQLGEGIIVVVAAAGLVVVANASVVDVMVVVVAGVGAGTGDGVGVGLGIGLPPEGSTVMSAQFQNCSPHPECPFGPEGPEQDPCPAVHQADLDPTQ